MMNSHQSVSNMDIGRATGLRLRFEWPIAFLLVCLLQTPAAYAAKNAQAMPAVHVVTIQDMKFVPAALTVRQGDQVTWVNKDLVPHTASASGSQFDSGAIAAGASWTYTVKETGTLDYVCRYHPGMRATLVVK